MAKTKQGKRDVQSYTIKGTNKVVQGKPLPAFLIDAVAKIWSLTGPVALWLKWETAC
jgi:hypothetical protein